MSVAPKERVPLWFVPVGFVIGMAGALCGIGGGIFAGPLLHAVRGLALKRSAATALMVVLATTTASTVAELQRADSELDLAVVLALSAGALAGAELGFRVQNRIDERALKTIFALVLGLAGLRVLLFTSAVRGGLVPGPIYTEIVAAVVGVCGGFLTPLLGVAGGVFMVPALFLSLAQLGFGGARACALAAGAVAALRSLWLHARAGNVEFRLGGMLAIGALVGALGGVVAAHDPLLAHVGRVLLGSVLVLQSLRFASELAAR